MSAQRVADTTLAELKEFVEEIVERRIHAPDIPNEFDSIDAINDFIDQHRWMPPPGSPSSLELLHQDRDHSCHQP